MKIRTLCLAVAATTVAACSTSTPAGEDKTLPEAVAQMAAGGQDLSTARLRAIDNCYWYEHRNPIETTLLPLRTVNGNPICAA